MLGIVLFLFLYYSGVPLWVWNFFAIGILISIGLIFIKEALMRFMLSSSWNSFLLILYILLQITVIMLFIVGLAFVIKYSSIPWWIWTLLLIAILCSMTSTILYNYNPNNIIVSTIFSLIAGILIVIALILFIIYSNTPWWVWLLVMLMIIFEILASVFEPLSERT